MSEESVKLFISYSHRDETLRQQLDKHLAPLKAQKIIEAWHDRQIQAGEEWAEQIDENLNRADIILLLISPDFVASNYCYNIELTQALKRHEEGEAIVVPVILEPCDWSWLPFAKLQAFPKDGKAVTVWSNQNEALLDVVTGLRKQAQALLEQRRQAAGRKQARRAQFLKKVEGALTNKVISDIERDTLDELREELGLSAEDAAALERQVARRQQESEKAQNNYRKTLTKLIERGSYPFSEATRQELEARWKDLGLTEAGARRIEQPLLAAAEAKYQQQKTTALPEEEPPPPDVAAEPPPPAAPPPAPSLPAPRKATRPGRLPQFKTVAELQGHSGWFSAVKTVAISPDGRVIASSGLDGVIKLWNRRTGEEIRTLAGDSGSVYALAFSSDGKALASGDTNYTVRLWNWQAGKELVTLSGHSDDVLCVAFSPAGDLLASGSKDDTCKLWSWQTGEELTTFSQADDVRAVSFTADGSVLIILATWTITLQNLRTQEATPCKPAEGTLAMYSMALSPDGETLAAGSQDGNVAVWNVQTGELRHTLEAHISSFLDGAVETVAFSPDGHVLASAGANNSDKTIKLWRPSTGKLLQTLTGHEKGVSAVTFSPDGRTLISGSYDQTVRIWG